jgi:threonine dehydratase
MPGAITFAINRREVAGALAVDDDEVRRAMTFAASHLKVVLEPSGAAALAAILAKPPQGRRAIAIVLSGGNVDSDLLAKVLAGAP